MTVDGRKGPKPATFSQWYMVVRICNGTTKLQDWLDLSLNPAVVPSSLLILSRAFTLAGRTKPVDAVVATASSLPDEVVDTIGTVLPSEDSVSERRRKLKFLEMQEELIKCNHNTWHKYETYTGRGEKKKEKEEKAKQKKEEKAILTEQEAAEEDLALKEMIGPTAREEEEMIEAKQHDQQQLCNVSRALAVLASASYVADSLVIVPLLLTLQSVSKERQEFPSLVNKEKKLYNSMLEREDTEGAEEAKKAYMAATEESDDLTEVASEEKVLSALIDKLEILQQQQQQQSL
ncbi:hypothetical protein TRIUR3_14798 [Triticum urartu]|uniref:Uncharacterized protein n=1 Tax=Triticum urartu TaxID=4572 RepID=M7ZC11_TRIUA|nr:hypothetical protein TRIUR3_14798 [Triticum urartu]